jgi:uncharacterized protein (TIGR02231 family)
MKKIVLFIFLLITTHLFALEIDMSTKVDAVTIYHSGALVIRTGDTDLKPGVNELIFKNLSSKIVLNSLKVLNKEVTILNKTIIRKLTDEEFSQLVDQKDVLSKQLTLIESKYSEQGFISKVEELETMTDFYSKTVLKIKKDLRDIERQIEEAKKLENIQIDNEDAAILKLTVSIEEKLKDPFKLQYVCGGIGWGPAYDMVVESAGDKTIQVKYLAKVMSQTGENWDNVTVHLSSAFPLESPNDLPKATTPWVISGRTFSDNPNLEQDDKEEQNKEKQIAQLEGVEYSDIKIPAFLKMRTLKEKYSIKSNSTIFTFPIQSISLPATYHHFAFPSIDEDVYLVAEVTGWDTLQFVDGIANISFAGNEVGKSIIQFSEATDTLILPIGKDNSVHLKRTEIADQKYFKETTIGKKRKSTLAYKFELKNNNPFPIQFEMVDLVPISQTKSAEVEIGNISGASLEKETGIVTWKMELKPSQQEEKQLIFTVELDAEITYHFHHYRSTYRTRWKHRSVPKYYN